VRAVTKSKMATFTNRHDPSNLWDSSSGATETRYR
jgi:hypothetical protein